MSVKEFFEKVNFEKISRRQQKHEKLQSMQRVNWCILYGIVHVIARGKQDVLIEGQTYLTPVHFSVIIHAPPCQCSHINIVLLRVYSSFLRVQPLFTSLLISNFGCLLICLIVLLLRP